MWEREGVTLFIASIADLSLFIDVSSLIETSAGIVGLIVSNTLSSESTKIVVYYNNTIVEVYEVLLQKNLEIYKLETGQYTKHSY